MQNQNQKGISSSIGIIIIVAVAIVSVGGVLAYQYIWSPAEPIEEPKAEIPQGETADWQTYRNEEYGFEFKYPVEGYSIEENELGVSVINEKEAEEKNTYYEDCDKNHIMCPPFPLTLSITIKIYQNEQNLSENEWIKYNDLRPNESKECTINNIKGYCTLEGTYGGASPYFYKLHKYKKQIIEFSNINWPWNENGIYFRDDIIKNQILSTFRFID